MAEKQESGQPLLVAKDIRKVFGSRKRTNEVLKGLDLTVEPGEFVGVMGASGAGKTTFLNVLATIDRPTSGTITIDGKDIVKMKDKALSKFRRSSLGFIFQDYNLLDTLTAKENILLPLSLGNPSKKEAEETYSQLVRTLSIEDVGGHYPHELSGGQKQRVSAARALIHKPKILFADEPTGALDSKSAAMLLGKMEELNLRQKVTIMMVTHDPLASSYCSRVLFLRDGRLYTELYRGERTRQEFFSDILNVQGVLGGEVHASH
ncbi:ABC transporter ATP-binding protein [Evansella clarkii]|jgi:bacitracin transport system ATP-binding protein|uniref:ABC transporter ATP-binding protein n=1 Tax=Evansella clarkii TaxID=79879 RepID=UPI00099623A8|nr:ABC transporter ATP-binding protein [Evansella clarkii]